MTTLGLLLSLACLPGTGCRTAACHRPPLASPSSWTTEAQPLFNGRDLAGWHTWLVDTHRDDPRQVFSVTNGMIRISGDGLGYLATESDYRDYELTLEWRWGTLNTSWGDRVDKARDSGVFLHATGPDGNSHDGGGAFMAAIECNVFQGAVGDFLLIRGSDSDGTLLAPRLTAETAAAPDADGWFSWQAGGVPRTLTRWGRLNALGKAPDWRDELDFRGPHDQERPRGEWNRLVCQAQGDLLRIHLNGTLVNEARRVWPTHGRILLQCEGSEIFFRRVDLRPLVPGTRATPGLANTPDPNPRRTHHEAHEDHEDRRGGAVRTTPR